MKKENNKKGYLFYLDLLKQIENGIPAMISAFKEEHPDKQWSQAAERPAIIGTVITMPTIENVTIFSLRPERLKAATPSPLSSKFFGSQKKEASDNKKIISESLTTVHKRLLVSKIQVSNDEYVFIGYSDTYQNNEFLILFSAFPRLQAEKIDDEITLPADKDIYINPEVILISDSEYVKIEMNPLERADWQNRSRITANLASYLAGAAGFFGGGIKKAYSKEEPVDSKEKFSISVWCQKNIPWINVRNITWRKTWTNFINLGLSEENKIS